MRTVIAAVCLGFLLCISMHGRLLAHQPEVLRESGVDKTGATGVLPSETDPRITAFNKLHFIWLPKGVPRNQLLVFLPGTGGAPNAHMSFAVTAQRLGYHVISLMYPDAVAAQTACGWSRDPDAHIKFRLAIIRGGNFERLHVSRIDSIEGRLAALLRYVIAHQPNRGWTQFYNQARGIEWNKVCVSGASQGGGHAYIIAKYHPVSRVIMLASPKDYSLYFQRPPKGFDSNTQTPIGRMFAFNHVRDNGNGCTHAQQRKTLQQMGMTRLGIAEIEKAGPDFNHAHVLYTDVSLPTRTYHGSVLKRRFERVWIYMLTEKVD
ncbi:MAG: hypothetical protein WBG50_02650 [Desulfomonilaceae bacterium]